MTGWVAAFGRCRARRFARVLALAPLLALRLLGRPAGTRAADPSPLPDLAPLSAAAAYVVDSSAGVPLYALHADDRRAPASLAKLMTALVVLEHAALDEPVTIDPSDRVDIAEQSHVGDAGLIPGDVLTVDQLLEGLLIPSGSDAARALARHVGAQLPGGDPRDPAAARAAFVAAMNAKAAAMGLANTHFANASGDDASGQYTSARDLATLATAVLRQPRLAAIVAMHGAELVAQGPTGRHYAVATTNTLLLDPANPYGVHGVKTGTTPAAGGNLVTVADFDGNQVVAVVLGAPYADDPATGELVTDDRYPDTLALFAALRTDERWIDPAAPQDAPGLAGLGAELAAWQATLPPGTPRVPVPSARLADLRYRLRLGPPAAPGQPVGVVRFFVGADPDGELPLVQAGA